MTPRVSVVVVTAGRDTVYRACESVLRQTVAPALTVVVDSCDDGVERRLESRFPEARILTSTARNAAFNRNLGMRSTDGDFIAFLDDDDWWEPTWLETAIGAMGPAFVTRRHPVLVTSSFLFHRTSGGIQVRPRGPMPDDPRVVLNELVRRRHLTCTSASIQTSTMVVTRQVAEAISWPQTLGRHSDWEFFRRVSHLPDARWLHLDARLVHVVQGSPQSLSELADWETRMAWLTMIQGELTPAAESDFLVQFVLRDALIAHSTTGIRSVADRLLELHRTGSARAWLVALSRWLGQEIVRSARPRTQPDIRREIGGLDDDRQTA